jgi:nitrogenase iron protein NifH
VTAMPTTLHASAGPHPPPKRYCSKSVRTQGILFGCAFNGAAHTVMQIRDAAVVIHGPQSCAHLSSQGMVSAARRAWDRYGLNLDRGRDSSVHCSRMDENTVIFGGNHSLEETIRKAAARHSGPLFVVTTCASGIIGDDARLVLEGICKTNGRKPVSLIAADGDITGDYMQGVLDAMRTVAEEWIEPHIPPEADTVNIVGEKNLATNTEENFQVIRELLEALGLRVNCRFIRRCTSAELGGFQRAGLNLLAHDDVLSREVRNFLTDRYQATFASSPFPVGLQAASDWLREVAAHFDREDTAELTIARRRKDYDEHVARLRPALEGKRLFIAAQNHRIDWVLDTALDLGMEVLKVGILESVWDDSFLSRYQGRVPMVFPYPREQREEDLRRLNPDLMLINYPWRDLPDGFRFDNISVCPDVGFLAGIAAAERWRQLMRIPAREGWRRDLQI